ncbi:MAG: hypothetical protein ACREGC_02120, partial [Minisyncoccia bacterium]
VYTDDSGKTWLSYTDFDKGNPDGGAKSTKRTYWIDYDSMKTIPGLAQVYDYPLMSEVPQSLETSLVGVTIDGSDTAVANVGSKTPIRVGIASTLPVNTFNQLIATDGLTPDNLH